MFKSLHSLTATIVMVVLLGGSGIAGYAQDVLLGMKIEKVAQEDAGIAVVSTGAEFFLEKNGNIRCFQRIPARREIACIQLPKEVLPLQVGRQNDFACVVAGKGVHLTLQGDSLIILKAQQDFNLAFKGLFKPAYQAEKEGKWLFIDDTGGFGVYPVQKKETRTPDFRQSPWGVNYCAVKGDELWISVFPPRPYNWQRAYRDLAAHEGNQGLHRFPSDSLIQSTAKHCKVMIVHSWFWPGGDRDPWKIPQFVLKNAQDQESFSHMRDELHRNGVGLLPYFSPFYYAGKDFFSEVKRALDEYQVDGLYFDGVSFDFRTSYEIVRKTRQMLGNDRLLFSHCSTDPLGSNRIYCPFIDTYCDYIYRGEAGKGGLELDDFLRWTVSGYNISNAVGYWVYTGSDKAPYVQKTPTTNDIDAAIRNEVRIPRTEIGYEEGLAWKPNDGHLQLFDSYYYGKLASRYEELKSTGQHHAESDEPSIVCMKDASRIERLAAKEVRRYLYLRSGRLPRIVADLPKEAAGGLIVVGTKGQFVIEPLLSDAKLKATVGSLASEQYVLKTIQYNGQPVLLIVGGEESGVLHGAYRFAEHLGVRFYLHGDVVPDKQAAFTMPVLDETRKPLFDRRGIQPFHDFPEGPDWWSRDGYKAVLSQLPKMGMNFFGLHTYPESPMWSHVGPEPLVWIGPPDELAADGKVKASYPSRHFAASNVNGAWGYRAGKTGDYVFGTADLFDRDDYGADYMRDTCPWNKMPAEQCNALFDRMGEFLGDVFTFARRRGIKTCLGTETPLIVPTRLKERLQAAGKNPADPAVVQELYEGIFQRIVKIHPLDYYWLWTPENWTMTSVNQEQVDATVADFRAMLAAVEKIRPPFTLATCGWVLGPPQSPSLFDEFLPKEMPMSCISRGVGFTPVEPGFAKVTGRPKWAIPWLEDDTALTTPQLWAGRMRRDAFDALRYGCTGLMGIHWRTRILAPNVAALAQAAWDQHGWSDGAARVAAPEGDERYLPIADFYADWARAEFGPEVADLIAAIFTRLDGRLPRPAEWPTSVTAGPGGIKPDERPWEQVGKEYGFVDELAAIRPKIAGPGNLDRFDYWLNSLRHLRSVARVRCIWARFNAAMDAVKGEKDSQSQKRLARELALPLRKELVAAFAELHQHLLATVTNSSELGTACNWQQQTLPALLTAPGEELAKRLGEELPADAMPSKQYVGEPRLFVLDIRSDITAGETLRLKAIVLGPPPQDAAVHWRPLGSGPYSGIPLSHLARGVYTATFPADATKTDFEYYVQATLGDQPMVFPKTAPECNQTVVVEE